MTLQWNGPAIAKHLHDLAEVAARRGAEELLDISNERVPDDPLTFGGDLRASGKVSSQGTTSAVSYGTRWAVIQHERMDYEHRPGQRAKYLESAMSDARGPVTGVILQAMKI
jgi:hypothetical protein